MGARGLRRSLDLKVAAIAQRFGGRLPNHVIAAPVFLLLCLATCVIVVMSAAADIKSVQSQKLEEVAKWRKAVTLALDAANRTVTAPSCTPKFQEQLRAIAFWPDGLNEFLYLPSGTILCSAVMPTINSAMGTKPDVTLARPAVDIWIERDLTQLGLTAARGTIVRSGKFATVVPNIAAQPALPPWLSVEFGALGANGAFVPISGRENLYANLVVHKAATATAMSSGIACSEDKAFCVAAVIELPAWVSSHIPHLFSGTLILFLCALLIAVIIGDEVRRFFSFEARMTRNLAPENIVVAYQPIYDLKEQKISGVEILARYRDIDGTIVYPDKFIDLVLASGKTIEFTRLVVDAARADLSRHWTFDTDLEVNINVFPRDLGSTALFEICDDFKKNAGERLKLAVEIVEYEEIDSAKLSEVVNRFHAEGIKIYIDDFGSGYSSVESVSTLPVDGIKLERSFAMAPPDSIMGRMFLKVIELLQTTGKPLIIEGVEDVTKIGALTNGDCARYAQGYCIGKPMPIADFIKLAESPPTLKLDAAA